MARCGVSLTVRLYFAVNLITGERQKGKQGFEAMAKFVKGQSGNPAGGPKGS
jgi:hypothetical protein